MKKFIFISLFATCSILSQAQLKVDSNGDIAMKGSFWSGYAVSLQTSAKKPLFVRSQYYTNGNWANSVESMTLPYGSNYGVALHGTACNIDQAGQSGRSFAVMGRAGYATTGYNYGVFGQLIDGTYNGAAVYGTNIESDMGSYLDRRYAGYFNGPVKITGQLYTPSGISGLYLGDAISSTGSQNGIRSTQFVSSEIQKQLSCLSPRIYYVNVDRFHSTSSDDLLSSDTSIVSQQLSAIEAQVLSKQHYALSAEELEGIFPELVYVTEEGNKAINYIEMVPILVQAINELTVKVAQLEGSDVKRETRTFNSADGSDNDITLLSLGENKPNPFSNSTTIPVSIPESVEKAFIYVYDLTGKKVQQVDVAVRGRQCITLDSTSLTAGMYLYSLIADGKVVQTRRMIVEK